MATVHSTRRRPRPPAPTQRPGKSSRGAGHPIPQREIPPTVHLDPARLAILAIRIDAARASAVCIYTALSQYHADIDVDAAIAIQRAVSDPLADVVEELESVRDPLPSNRKGAKAVQP